MHSNILIFFIFCRHFIRQIRQWRQKVNREPKQSDEGGRLFICRGPNLQQTEAVTNTQLINCMPRDWLHEHQTRIRISFLSVFQIILYPCHPWIKAHIFVNPKPSNPSLQKQLQVRLDFLGGYLSFSPKPQEARGDGTL